MRSSLAIRFWTCFATAWLVALVAAGRADALIVASTADDVCAPSADPCTVNDTVQVVSGSVLDFGLRAVQVGTGGQLDFAGGSGTIRCGSFSAATPSAIAVKLRSSTGAGGSAIIEARGSCSGNPAIACLSDTDCAPASGTCSGAAADITLDGKVSGNADNPSSLALKAAGNVTLSQQIDLDGTTSTTPGGTLTVDASAGNIVIDGNVNASSGTLEAGGVVVLDAGGDIIVRGVTDLRGGDFDGGVMEATSGGEIRIEDDILLDSKAGEGFGGDLALAAGTDLTITGGTPVNPMLLRANGNTSIDNTGGDGGDQILAAGGTFTLGPFVKISSNGALPDGSGGDIDISGTTVTINGLVESLGNGGIAGGGLIDVFAGAGGISVASGGTVDAGSANGDGGDVSLISTGDVLVAGTVDVAGAGGGVAGALLIDSQTTATVQGTLKTDGNTSLGDTVRINACAVLIAAGALIDNSTNGGGTTLSGRAFLTVEAGAQVLASGPGGSNTFVYGNAAFPPAVNGTVTPVATEVLDITLPPCASCSVAADCDDSNPCTDDICDPLSGCMNPPNTNTCDDGNPCTTGDVCTAGQCVGQIPVACDDGNPCTDDSCMPDGSCVNTPNMNPCDDGSACTTGDTCSGGTCVGQPPPSCDDGNPCTRDGCDDVLGCINTEAPATQCLTAPRTRVQINNRTGTSKDRLKWKWDKGGAFTASDVGTPDTTTTYTLCVYDTVGSVPSTAARLDVAAGPAWTLKGSKWRYKDKTTASSGVDKMQIRFGDGGKTKLRFSAKGDNFPTPVPVSSNQLFAQDPKVTLQLFNSEGICWSADFDTAKTNTAERYKAQVK